MTYTSINPSALVARSTYTPKRPTMARVAQLVQGAVTHAPRQRPDLQARWGLFADLLSRWEQHRARAARNARVQADKAYLARYQARTHDRAMQAMASGWGA